MSITYKDAGVDIEKGDALVERIKRRVRSTYNNRVYAGVGGFACLYDIGHDKLISAGTDGVGTKLKIAQDLNIHNTIGIDLVAMCVNDVLCTGAQPLFFMDYLAMGSLDLSISESLIEGIVEGCNQSNIPLIGGETAEMPGLYKGNDYDLAGFAVGEVMKKDLIDGTKINENQTIIGIASSGFHSNGYSLIRKLIGSSETKLLKEALTPTRIYVQTINKLQSTYAQHILGMAHITGGGLTNIPRLNQNINYHIENLPNDDELSPLFTIIKKRSELPDSELYQTFNMGIGFVLITDRPDLISKSLSDIGEKNWILGHTSKGNGQVILKNNTILQ